MITKVLMPKLSEAMESGKVIQWLKKEGDPVKGGDVIAEIETDKANVEIEAFGSGVLRRIVVDAGGQAPVGELIAVIAEATDDIGALVGAAAPAAGAAAPAPALPPEETYRPRPETGAVIPLTAEPRHGVAPVPVAATPATGRVKASPLAKKIAARSGLDLRLVQGSGPGGRVVRRDVEAAIARGVPAPAAAAPAARPVAAPPRPAVEFEDRPLSAMRATIAKRLPLSKGPVPHFYVTAEIGMDRAGALRAELNALEGSPKVSVTDMVVRACALALLRHPGVNASFQGQAVRVHHRAHIGIAVALDEGLITPVLRDCDAKPLTRIAVEARDLAERARQGKLRAQELTGATFSISNLGMFDVEEFSAIINPPEGAILAVGSVLEKPVAVGGAVRVGRRMRVTLSCDHRVMDGATGARFLQAVKGLLEEPLRLLV
jgi:pyruvate dehydrogenase E2 component (dihydrolipoamide acetyltransferase)